MPGPDAVVVGSGPNGMAAAVTLARAGLEVEVHEGAATPGGGCRTAALTLPGFHHDVCSAVHPLLVASPFFRSVELERLGVRLRFPDVAFSHPLDDGRAAAVVTSLDATADDLGDDATAYRRLIGPVARGIEPILAAALAPLRRPPARPLAVAPFAALGLLPATALARGFRTDAGRALLGGVSAHSMLPLSAPVSAGFGLILAALAHTAGWPVVEGGSGAVSAALITELADRGGRVLTGRWVRSLNELPPARLMLLDVTARQAVELAGPRLGRLARWQLARFRYGPGVCKVDWALDGPVPWTAEACRRTATVHVGGRLEEIVASEATVAAGRHPERPFCIVAQPGVVDSTRAPAGRQTLWAYCHTPPGSDVDMTGRIEAQIERFAPGFRDRVLARVTRTAAGTEAYNPNFVGGDINGGLASLAQTLARPTARWNPYRTGADGVYLCSASTPPGGGVHGMCGYQAALTALADLRRAVR